MQRWEEKLKMSHLAEMVFGENALVLKHLGSNTKIHFNGFDALAGWKQEGLTPVEVPAAAKWKFRSKPSQQVILDYDYTFTTPYCGSGVVEKDQETVVLYEDELAANGVSLLTVKVARLTTELKDKVAHVGASLVNECASDEYGL
ncbi:TIP41-like protein [Brassica napus]|uniref:TIP41-like protein n=1 Tax=Brassica napus TaxID=3708 RepID=UPI002078E514|nr:TIP41-like protein [Brassica napus]